MKSTCLNKPCLLNNEIVVPPTGPNLSGPKQSYIVKANCAVLGKSLN